LAEIMADSGHYSIDSTCAHGLRSSMSGKGNYYDSASVATFFKSLKAEPIWRQSWPTRRQAASARSPKPRRLYSRR
jgi:transposase InsO family protein